MDEARMKARERYQAQNGLSVEEADALWPDLPPRTGEAPQREEPVEEPSEDDELAGHTVEELREMADGEGVGLNSDMRKADIIAAIEESRRP